MTWNIIGCGETAAAWDGHGLSIGVNDCEKYGKRVQALVVVNPPHEFGGDRLKQILRTPAFIYSNDYCAPLWRREFGIEQGHVKIRTIVSRRWSGKLQKGGHIYHADTSPFMAMSFAHRWGAQELILWGVDFKTHQKYHPGAPYFGHEITRYIGFAKELGRNGVKVWTGAHGSALEEYIPVKPR